jgi:hypothetical protein
VAVSLPEELVTLYLLDGEVATATTRDARGGRPITIAAALEKVPAEPEYGELCFHEADEEQLGAMYATHAVAMEPWPAGMSAHDPAALFPYLSAMSFDGVVEIVAHENVNYLIFRNGSVVRTFLTSTVHGSVVERVKKLFARDGRIGELKVTRWGVPAPLPVQAPPALVEAYRELVVSLIDRLVQQGRDSAPAIAEHARQTLVAKHPVLEGFAAGARPGRGPLTDTEALTLAIADWVREVIWAAVDHDATSPEALLKELTWDRRHLFQSSGLYANLPWKVV